MEELGAKYKDVFLIGRSSTYTAGSTGGGTTGNTNLKVSRGDYGLMEGGLYNGQPIVSVTKNTSTLAQNMSDNGINFLPPYIAVYIWKRVA